MKINLFNNKYVPTLFSEVLSPEEFFNDAFSYIGQEFIFNSKENKFELVLSLPGYDKKDIDVFISKNMVNITASQSFDREYFYKKSNYKTCLHVPEHAILDSCAAEYKDGILKISFDAQEQNPNLAERKVEVK